MGSTRWLVWSLLWKCSLSGCSHTPPRAACQLCTTSEHREGMWNGELGWASPNPNSARSLRGEKERVLHRARLINCFTAFKPYPKYINCYIYICLSFQALLLEGVQVVPSIKIPRQGRSGVSRLGAGQGGGTWSAGLLAPIQTRLPRAGSSLPPRALGSALALSLGPRTKRRGDVVYFLVETPTYLRPPHQPFGGMSKLMTY